MSDRKKYYWGDLITLEYGKALRDYREGEGKVPVFGTNGPIGYTDSALCSYPSVIIGRKGAYRGVHYSDRPFFVIDTAFYLKPKVDFIDLRFCYYYLKTVNINAMDSGSAIPSTSREEFYRLSIDLPNYGTQKLIASILSSLDDKIELNLQMNQSLETMAQAIFKEWFVNFNFPGFDGKLVDGLPKGWKEVPLEKIIELIIDHRGKTPIKLGGAWVNEGITAISAKNVKDGRLVNLDDVGFVNDELYNKWMKEKLQAFDILLTSEGPLGEVAIIISNINYCLSQRLFAIRVNSKCKPCYLYSFLRSEVGKSNVQKRATGSTVAGIRQSELRMVEILLPNIAIQELFNNIVSPILQKIDENYNEIKLLSQIRDNLLPKLMSGHIEVKA